MTSAICNTCEFQSISFGDIKPYLSDRVDEFAIYSIDNDSYVPLCCDCWKKQNDLDTYLYNEMKIPIKQLTWDKPFPKDHNETAPTIIKNIVVNNTTNNINYNTSNLIPTYNTNTTNTTTNNITKKITKIIDPDGIIDPLSSDYKRVLKNANKYKAEREKKEAEIRKKEAEIMKIEAKKQLLAEQYEILKKFDDEKEEQINALREKEQMSKETRKQELRDNQIKLEIAENKKRNQQRMEKQNSEIEAIEKGYDVTFGELSSVEQPDETLKQYNDGLLMCMCCDKCKVFKAYPNGFLDTYGKLNENRKDGKFLCSECLMDKSQKVCDIKSYSMVKCSCGVTYYGATQEAIHKHETSERHIKALGRNKTINGKTYSVLQLRKICGANVNSDGTLKVAGFSRMSKEEILEKVLKIENLVIPEGL